ncbi:hypothetical protein [Flavobacterium sp.]|uniref:hypothetical protein n=1 Tax=Flavobacterium sp. TaxID=239 RepID=UPI00286A8408|nr:hypothetical protein [Flavobacterium sp.]
MSKEINIIAKPTKDQVFNAGLGVLELKKAESFNYTIQKMDDVEKTKPSRTNMHASTVAFNKYNSELKKFEEMQTKLLEDYKDLNWAWQLVNNGVDAKQITHNESFTKGLAKMKINGSDAILFPEFLEGGGMVWLEAFDNTEFKNAALGKSPRGIFIRALGTPKIIGVQWKYIDTNGKTVDIPKDAILKFGQKIQLHIYTKGLYGQEIDIQLMNKNMVYSDNKLPALKRENGVAVDLKPGQLEPDMPKNTYFRREVVAKVVDGETILSSSPQGKLKTGKETGKTSVQKAVVDIILDPFWSGSAFANSQEITLYAKIKHDKTEELVSFKSDVVQVKGQAIPKLNIESGNNPLMSGSVETNVAAFQHCRYDKIELKKQSSAGSTIVFDSKDTVQRTKKSLDVEIVAGKKGTYILDFDIKSVECNLKSKHTTKEITVTAIPKDFELKVEPSSKAEHKVEEKKSELVKTESKSTTTSGMIKTNQKEDVPIEKGLVTVRQNQIEFDAFYNYDIPKDGNSILMFIKTMQYFWLPNSLGKTLKIKANIQTCAFKQDVNIAIYPDIKWSLIFGFNVSKDQLTALIPSWDQEKTVSAFEWKDNKFKKKDNETPDQEAERIKKQDIYKKDKESQDKINSKINNKMLDVFKTHQGTPKPKDAAKPTPTKGKISTLVEIMKNVNISLKAQIYEDRNIELTKDFAEKSQASEFYKDIYDKLRWAADMMDGKLDNPKNKGEGDNAINEYLKENELNLRVKHLTEALTRKPQEVEIVYPKFSLGGSWQYETVDGKKHAQLAGRSGLAYNVAFAAKPLIGLEIKWHILDLLCRRHPIAYAVLAAVKTLLAAIGDNPDGIKVDMWVKGEINADVKFEGNFLHSDKKLAFKGESHITAGIDITIKIVGKIVMGTYDAIAEVGVGGKGEVGLGQEGTLGVDNEGWFVQTSLIFDGIKLSFEVFAGGKITRNRMKEDGTVESSDVVKKESKIEGEITLLAHTFKSPPFYFKKTTT